MMTKLILVRHGQTAWNHEGRFRGRADIPLDDIGLAQARATAQYIAARWKPAAVYCSPLSRARQMAEILAAPFMLHERAHPGFLDVDFGAWQGLTEADVRERWQQALDVWCTEPKDTPIPGGERLETAQLRAMGALHEVVNRHSGKVVVIVGHTVINRLILLAILDIDFAHFWHLGQDLGALNLLEHDGRDFKLLQMNLTHHLEAD